MHFGLVFQQFNLFPHYNAITNIKLASVLLAKEKLRGEYRRITAETKAKKKNLCENAKAEISSAKTAILQKMI